MEEIWNLGFGAFLVWKLVIPGFHSREKVEIKMEIF